ncbi:MAG: hypothetical protein Tsb0033_27850 [Winogradskyella sp.]
MIQPQELRIGNYINIPKTNQDAFISAINGLGYLSVNNDFIGLGKLELKDIKPIPLTEQWLIDFGMEMPTNEDPIFEYGKAEYDDCFNHFKKTSQSLIDASFEYDGKEFWADSNGFWFKIMHTYTHVEYVHQFQNLIFALTGKELTKKLSTYDVAVSKSEFCKHPEQECRTLNDNLKVCNVCNKVIDK